MPHRLEFCVESEGVDLVWLGNALLDGMTSLEIAQFLVGKVHSTEL